MHTTLFVQQIKATEKHLIIELKLKYELAGNSVEVGSEKGCKIRITNNDFIKTHNNNTEDANTLKSKKHSRKTFCL